MSSGRSASWLLCSAAQTMQVHPEMLLKTKGSQNQGAM